MQKYILKINGIPKSYKSYISASMAYREKVKTEPFYNYSLIINGVVKRNHKAAL
jgi:hypothetical protein